MTEKARGSGWRIFRPGGVKHYAAPSPANPYFYLARCGAQAFAPHAHLHNAELERRRPCRACAKRLEHMTTSTKETTDAKQ